MTVFLTPSHDTLGVVGSTIGGRYVVEEIAGEGGFGVVYRGYRLGSDQPVAIKFLKIPAHATACARRRLVERFAEEGKLLFRLSEHRAIVQVFDASVLEIHGQTVPYLVMEWLEGISLADYLIQRRVARRPPLGEIEALELLRAPIEALAFAHQQRIVHRDIKPANLFLVKTATGWSAKLLDFGLAKLMDDDHGLGLTTADCHAFSPHYGAPEQFYAKLYGQTGPWTDVHAIGLVLTEMVTGYPPFHGSEIGELYECAVADRRPTPYACGAWVSDAFEAMCASTVALAPHQRYGTAGELLAAIDTYLTRKASATLDSVSRATIPYKRRIQNRTQPRMEHASSSGR